MVGTETELSAMIFPSVITADDQVAVIEVSCIFPDVNNKKSPFELNCPVNLVCIFTQRVVATFEGFDELKFVKAL